MFYDFEVFSHDWLVVLIDMNAQAETVIHNDREGLVEFYEQHRKDIWVGFNSRRYDQYILKCIIAGLNPKELNDWIIEKDRPAWEFSTVFREIPLNNYDVMNNIDRGLKAFEGFMGNSIKESSVPFDIDRPLTTAELQETIKYCRHDVEQTIEVFMQRKSDFEAQIGLLKMFKLPLSDVSKTKVQLSAKILEASKRTYHDEFDISFPPTLQLSKYRHIADWYKEPSNRDYTKSLDVMVAGVPHSFGWGGVHGAIEKYVGEGFFVNMDVASLYPSLMIQYNLHSRSCNPQKFNEIVATRLKYKHEHNPLQAPLKIVINGTYGAMKDKNNPLYDPRQANNVCVYGQLLLLDLMEKLEPHCQIIQSNTDGVLVKLHKYDDYDLIDDIAYEWEKRTGLNLEFDEYVKVYQGDVNNYIIIDADGKWKSKGAYVKKLNNLDYDLPIVNKAIVEYMVHGVPIETTVYGCDELKEFQQVKKISNKYTCIMHGNKRLNEKCVRCFASKDWTDGGLTKLHATTGRHAKIESTPEHAFIVDENVNDTKCPPKLDKRWYVDLAKSRLKDKFGLVT